MRLTLKGRWAALQSKTPSKGVRALLAAEPFVYTALVLTYTVILLPTPDHGTPWYYVVYVIMLAALPIVLNLLHGDCPADSGLRTDNLRRAAVLGALVTALLVGLLVAGGFATGGWHWSSWKRLVEKTGLYILWGFVQQYLVQAFILRRLLQAGVGRFAAVLLAAALFGIVHAPNWPLVALTFGAGLIWSRLFLAAPNLIVLGLSHATLAVLAYHALPEAWLNRMVIGGMYIERVWR